jgi:DNA replication protein DnaC
LTSAAWVQMIASAPGGGQRMRAIFPGRIWLPTFVMTGKAASLAGREEELSRLRELVAPPYPETRMLLLLGDPGMGKTVLLADATREATLAGARVLAVAGRESEQDLALAGLYQLVRPVLDRVAGLQRA